MHACIQTGTDSLWPHVDVTAMRDRDPPERKIQPFASRLLSSLKVIGTNTDRSSTYNILLVRHSNHEQ